MLKKVLYVTLNCFDTIPIHDRRADRRTDRTAISISRVSIAMLTHDKKRYTLHICKWLYS